MAFLQLALLGVAAQIVCLGQGVTCAPLQSAVKSTYNFKPSKLSQIEQKKKSAEMDSVWNLVEAKPDVMLPCLIAEMQAPGADSWFVFDAGSLLAKLDHSPRANPLILRGCEIVDLEDIALADWIGRLTTLALQDVDISVAANRWMRYAHASYSLPQHAFTAKRRDGAFFLYGSMDETLATQALLRIASDPMHPERELALSLLGGLATPAADAAFRSVDLTGFSAEARSGARSMITNRPTFERRTPAKSTRAELLAAFRPIADRRDFRPFMEKIAKVPDGERDVVTVLGREDLPLIRKVRRTFAASGSPDLINDYPFFTAIIWTLQNRP